MDMSLCDMQAMQRELWEKHRETWSPMEPYYARHSLLWMIEEVGEVISLIKKRGEKDIAENPATRRAFVEELADVLMYYNDVLMRCGIAPEELGAAYRAKHARNMGRDYDGEYAEMFAESK